MFGQGLRSSGRLLPRLVLAVVLLLMLSTVYAGRLVVIELPDDDTAITRSELELTFKLFINAWRNRDYDVQAPLVAADFLYRDQSKTQDRNEYLANKRRLYAKYPWVIVEASNLHYQLDGNLGIVTYRQHFKSPTYESYGDEKMTFRKTGERVELIRDEFWKDQ